MVFLHGLLRLVEAQPALRRLLPAFSSSSSSFRACPSSCGRGRQARHLPGRSRRAAGRKMASVQLEFQASAGEADPQSRPVLVLGQLQNLHRLPWAHVRGKLQPRVTEEVTQGRAGIASLLERAACRTPRRPLERRCLRFAARLPPARCSTTAALLASSRDALPRPFSFQTGLG